VYNIPKWPLSAAQVEVEVELSSRGGCTYLTRWPFSAAAAHAQSQGHPLPCRKVSASTRPAPAAAFAVACKHKGAHEQNMHNVERKHLSEARICGDDRVERTLEGT
jgi:hypothetical protein